MNAISQGIDHCLFAINSRGAAPPAAATTHWISVQFNGVRLIRIKSLSNLVEITLNPVRFAFKNGHARQHKESLRRVVDRS